MDPHMMMKDEMGYPVMYKPTPRDQLVKMKILPFEIQFSENAFHSVSQNELVYLNSLSGKIERMPGEKIELIKQMARSDCVNESPDSNYEIYFAPVKIIKKNNKTPEEYYRERVYKERIQEYNNMNYMPERGVPYQNDPRYGKYY